MEKLLSNFIKPTAEKTDNILDHVFGLGVKETDKKSRTDAQETNGELPITMLQLNNL